MITARHKRFQPGSRQLFAATLVLVGLSVSRPGRAQLDARVQLVESDGTVGETVLEALLAPGEFPGRRFVHLSAAAQANFCLDASLGAAEPFIELHPERLRWPQVAGLALRVESDPVQLKPAPGDISDDDLDAGFTVEWTVIPLGQRFQPVPHFAVGVVAARVVSLTDGRTLIHWQADPPPPVCRPNPPTGAPKCDLPGVSREASAMALSPDGTLLALALGGLHPRLEVYTLNPEPTRRWQALFPTKSGGVQETTFSADGRWIVALTGRGRLHRFDARRGGRHMSVRSKGRAACAIPPGRVMAVAGESGEVSLWYLSDGTIAWHLPARQLLGPIDKLATSGNGRRFATLEYDEQRSVVRVWEINKRVMLAQIEVEPYVVADIALDDQGKQLYVAHEQQGLLSAPVRRGVKPRPLGEKAAARCTGRIQWISNSKRLSCVVSNGVIELNSQGRKIGERVTNIKASKWITTVATGGSRMAAVGDGHLLIW